MWPSAGMARDRGTSTCAKAQVSALSFVVGWGGYSTDHAT